MEIFPCSKLTAICTASIAPGMLPEKRVAAWRSLAAQIVARKFTPRLGDDALNRALGRQRAD